MNLTAALFNSYIDTIRGSYHSRIEHIGSIAEAISRDDLVQDINTIWPDHELLDKQYFELMSAIYICIAQTEHPVRQIRLEQSVGVLAGAYYLEPYISLEARHAQAILSRYKLRIQDNMIVDCSSQDTYLNDNCILQKIHTNDDVLFRMYLNAPLYTAYKVPEIIIGPLNDIPAVLYNIIKDNGSFNTASISDNNHNKISMPPFYIKIYSNKNELYQLIEWMFESKQQAMSSLLHAWLSKNDNYDIEECLRKVSPYERDTWTGLFEHFLCGRSMLNNLSDINKRIKLQHEFGVNIKDIVVQMYTPETIGIAEYIEFSY